MVYYFSYLTVAATRVDAVGHRDFSRKRGNLDDTEMSFAPALAKKMGSTVPAQFHEGLSVSECT